MKTFGLVSGVLFLGILLGYLIFLLTNPEGTTVRVLEEESYRSNSSFQNTVLPSQSTPKTSTPFQTQSIKYKHAVVE